MKFDLIKNLTVVHCSSEKEKDILINAINLFMKEKNVPTYSRKANETRKVYRPFYSETNDCYSFYREGDGITFCTSGTLETFYQRPNYWNIIEFSELVEEGEDFSKYVSEAEWGWKVFSSKGTSNFVYSGEEAIKLCERLTKTEHSETWYQRVCIAK